MPYRVCHALMYSDTLKVAIVQGGGSVTIRYRPIIDLGEQIRVGGLDLKDGRDEAGGEIVRIEHYYDSVTAEKMTRLDWEE